MNAKILVVGQDVYVNGGFGPINGEVVKVEPQCVYVETANGRIRFNCDGKECGLDGKAYTYVFDPTFGPGPWEIIES